MELAPQLALLTAHAVHGLGHVLEVLLQLLHQQVAILALPQAPLVEGHWTCRFQGLIVDLQGKQKV